jgi:S1/P1 Nuclease
MRKTMTVRGACVAAALSLAFASTSAFAWGSEGHQYVGNLAWKLLNPNAQSHVRKLLGKGVTLGQAAVWPDCIRSVSGSPSSGYSYHKGMFTPKACDVFGNKAAEVQRMTDYASRNWTNCEYAGHNSQCNLSYHFADVNIHEHSDYAASYFGAHPYDVVHAIGAAETVLKCPNGQSCTAPAPFSIASKREALLLLAHFVGDVHQPLHVGAVYLDAQNAETGDNGAPTVGGNWLLLPTAYSENLHHSWDQIAPALGTSPDTATVASACPIAAASDPGVDTPEKWAGESVAAAKTAYSGMTFTRDPNKPTEWDVQFQDQNSYETARALVQKQRLVSAGARLAAVLNSIWPSSKVPTACKGIVQ